MERIQFMIDRSSSGGEDSRVLEETLKLAKIYLRLNETAEARLCAKRCLRAYRKMELVDSQGSESGWSYWCELVKTTAIGRKESRTVSCFWNILPRTLRRWLQNTA